MTSALVGLLAAAISLSGFGVDRNPNAPSGAEVLAYAPEAADFMVYLDLEAVVPRNYDALKKLVDSGQLARVPEIGKELPTLMSQLDMALGMARGAVGVDPIRTPKSVAAWVTYPRTGDPQFMIHVRGNFPKDFVTKLQAVSGGSNKTTTVAGRAAIIDDGLMLTSAADGSLLFGTPAWVKPRAERGPARTIPRPALLLMKARPILDSRPVFAMFSAPSKTALARIGREMAGRGDNALSDLVGGHTFASVSATYNSFGWTYQARTATGLERAEMASQGMLQLMRASHLSARGIANLFFAAIDSYKGTDRELDTIISMKGDLMSLVTTFTGDGKFTETLSADKRTRTVTVVASGKSLSDVMPLVGVAPLALGAGAMYFMTRSLPSAGVKEAPATKAGRRP